MNLSELQSLLAEHADRFFRIRLPDGANVPISFHVTEVGRIDKTFLDCGGTLRKLTTCQLQVWVGEDYHHRIETGKMASILHKAKSLLPDDAIPVEIEYEDQVISQYTISAYEMTDDSVVLVLANKHTECLAPELCGLPPRQTHAEIGRLPALGEKPSCCGSRGC